MKTIFSLLFMMLTAPFALAEGNIDDVWSAIEGNDARSLRQALVGVDSNVTRDKDGHTPLTLAASKASFECTRELLWAGASAELTDKKGKTARSYLKPGTSNFTSLNLLLRTHAFAQKEAGKPSKPVVPYRVIINDSCVDPNHSDYSHRYWINQAELNGEPGVDDDGNGFIDDTTGWNVGEDLPLRMPSLALEAIKDKAWLERLMDEYISLEEGTAADPKAIMERLSQRYENPLAKQLGVRMAKETRLNDLYYAKQVYKQSHGTHVAGIVLNASGGNAEMHGVSWEPVEGSADEVKVAILKKLEETMKRAAAEQPDYVSYMRVVRGEYLASCVKAGRRFSAYLRSSGAGVVNMSYETNTDLYVFCAQMIQNHYKEHGKNPESMKSFSCPTGLDLCGSLALELQIADCSFYALAMAQNPNVLFVVAAGNSKLNNDTALRVPAYLSRFFPNVISVASVGESLQLSDFSNFGVHSVQIAGKGEGIISSVLGGIRKKMSGTSMAAPEVAGIAAAIRFSYPDLTARDIRRILLISAKPSPQLKDKIASAAVVDRERALQLAATWSKGVSLFVDEAWDWPSAVDTTPVVHVPKGQQKPVEPPGAAGNAPETSQSERKKVGISSVGGFTKNWRVVATAFPQPRYQEFNLSKAWPSEWVANSWNSGRQITAMGGDANGWALVTTESPTIGAQKLVGYNFDQIAIKANMDEGLRIRCVAGYDAQWVFVMDKSTGYGGQRYTLPGPFNETRKEWIQARWKEGLRITAVAGEHGPKEKNSWVIVMSQNSGMTDQVYSGPGAWPADWIKARWKEGYYITSHTGYGNAWLVVMSKGVFKPSTYQSYSVQLEDPNEWIKSVVK